MENDSWEPARLIPVSGISGADEQERRGVSALLAVLASVKEFGRAITGQLGAPAGSLTSFIEVTLPLGDKQFRPDGLLQVTRGKQSWTALVEVKTGRNDLNAPQLEAYLDIAREQGFDCVLTISNELVTAPGQHPTSVDRKKLKKVSLQHLSWSQIHTEAVVERLNRSVADPDQAWILAELIRYLEHPRSGAVDFDDMGTSWVTVRDAVKARSLRLNDAGGDDVVGRFGQLVSFAGMRLSRRLGVDVRSALSKTELRDIGTYTQVNVAKLVADGVLTGALQVPNAAAPIRIMVDLRSGRVECSMNVMAPAQGRTATRINWLTRQLANAPDGVLVESWTLWARAPGPRHTLSDVRKTPLILADDPTKELRSFTVRLTAEAGTKRGQGRGSFVGSVLTLVDAFYEEVVQNIKPWVAPAPTVPKVQQDEAADSDDEVISGELPLKPTSRSSSPASIESSAASREADSERRTGGAAS